MNSCQYCKNYVSEYVKPLVFCDLECAKIWAVDLVANMDKHEDLISRILDIIREYDREQQKSQ